MAPTLDMAHPPRGHRPRTIFTGAPTCPPSHAGRTWKSAPTVGWAGLRATWLRRTDVVRNPSVTALWAVTAPLSGEPRGGRRLAALAHLFTTMPTPTSRTTRKGRRPRRPAVGLLPGLTGCRRWAWPIAPAFPASRTVTSAAPRIRSRASQPAHLLGGAAHRRRPSTHARGLRRFNLGAVLHLIWAH